MQPRTKSPWPDDARLAVSLVVNFEEGAELSVARGDERNEHIYEAVERVDGDADPCMESHFAYGVREGWPRIRSVLKQFGVQGNAQLLRPRCSRGTIGGGGGGRRWSRGFGTWLALGKARWHGRGT